MPNINIEVPGDLLRLVRIKCAEIGFTQKDFVIMGLNAAIHDTERLRLEYAAVKSTGYAVKHLMPNERDWKPAHDTACKCFICKPPKEK